MKKAAIIAAAVLALAVSAYALSDVRNTKHNLSNGSFKTNTYRSTNYNEICVFCHTPHSAGAWPLWNRNYTAGSFTVYSTVAFKPANYGGTGQPDSTSKLCFSCHENANSWSSVQLKNNSNLVGAAGNAAPQFNHNNFSNATALGLDLTNDHPIGFNYKAAQANTAKYELKDADTVATLMYEVGNASGIFAGDQMTCASCHDVHGKVVNSVVIPVLLRRSNASSLLCFACHTK